MSADGREDHGRSLTPMNEPISTERQALMSDAVERREMLRDEYARHDEETDGTVGGAVVGAALGAVVAGPVGALVGGALGAAVGGTAVAVDRKRNDGDAVLTGTERDR
jgi:uncharacterized protein YcfJ